MHVHLCELANLYRKLARKRTVKEKLKLIKEIGIEFYRHKGAFGVIQTSQCHQRLFDFQNKVPANFLQQVQSSAEGLQAARINFSNELFPLYPHAHAVGLTNVNLSQSF